MQKLMWFTCGLLLGYSALSITIASVPTKNRVTDDTAIYQNLSEIRVKKQAKLDFDSDIRHLTELESRYREKLPKISHPSQLKAPMQRISQKKYKFSGNSKIQRKNVHTSIKK